jgi:hypothetical protein
MAGLDGTRDLRSTVKGCKHRPLTIIAAALRLPRPNQEPGQTLRPDPVKRSSGSTGRICASKPLAFPGRPALVTTTEVQE